METETTEAEWGRSLWGVEQGRGRVRSIILSPFSLLLIAEAREGSQQNHTPKICLKEAQGQPQVC